LNVDLPLAAGIAVVASVALWLAALVLGRIDMRVTARGLRNGALIAAALFVIAAVIVALLFNGRAVFAQPLDLGGAIQLGLLVGAIVAVGYLWLGAVLIAIGLIFRSKPQWTTLGAWAAVPIVVVSLGFGYVSYRSVRSESAPRTSANGTISLNVSNGQAEPITAGGLATCAQGDDGTTTIEAGTTSDPHIVTSDGRLVTAQVSINEGVSDAKLALTIAGLATSNLTLVTSAGSVAQSGEIQLTAATWSGSLSWSCLR
jgi:hypothetical protein